MWTPPFEPENVYFTSSTLSMYQCMYVELRACYETTTHIARAIVLIGK